MQNNKKLKIVWICHFSNDIVQKHLPITKKSPQFAPWISLLLEEFEKIEGIELHVVSPFEWLKKDTYFTLNGIHYYFLKTGMPFIHRHWPWFLKLDYWTNFIISKNKIAKLINKINPDIINLHGVENAYYSPVVLKLIKFPILITIQGLFSFSRKDNRGYQSRIRIKNEQKIISQINHFGVRVKFLADYLKEKNPNAVFHWYKYPYKMSDISSYLADKTFDIVFFAKLSKDKGIEDLLYAIEIIKKVIPNVKVKIIGTTNSNYFLRLKSIASNLQIENNIEFVGFLPTQEDLHKLVSKAKICVLPTYNDILPGTIIESIFLKIPVIAYAANGVVDLNFEEEIIKLVEIGNIKELSNQIILLLENEELQCEMSNKAYNFAVTNFDNEHEAEKLIEAYRNVIKEYNKP